MSDLERRELRLGFIPLNDCAPLVVARELDLFAAEGLDVTLSREASWANVRDKVAVGMLDGAHILAPLPLAASVGAGGDLPQMIVPLSLSLNGSAITIAAEHAAAMRVLDPEAMAARPPTARPLARLIAERRERGERPLVFAVVFPFSMHNYELRYWLAEGGVDPDRDVRLVVTPPPRMAARLKSGDIDGFCVGAPWNALAVAEGSGEILIYASEFWRLGPDKAFGVTAEWAERHPRTLRAVIRALLKAAIWADEPGNRSQLASMLARPEYVDAPEAVVGLSLLGSPPYAQGSAPPESQDYLIFHRYAASYPWRSHAIWFLSQMLRWGQIGADVDLAGAAARVYRPEAFRDAAADLGVAAPIVDEKVEGAHAESWLLEEATEPLRMGPDLFFDGRPFDAAQAVRYAKSFEIGRFGRG
jgi:ABC-type nitrate/sulfonate/bicarbonate transport system substrate-binding protein